MSDSSYCCKESGLDIGGGEAVWKDKLSRSCPRFGNEGGNGMNELIPGKKRDEVPRKGPAKETRLQVGETEDEHINTASPNALVPTVVWPDVQPSLRSRLMDHVVLLSGRRKWWASAAVVQE